MLNGRRIVSIIALLVFTSLVFGATLEENFNDYLHYAKIGRFQLAKDYAKLVLESDPDPVQLLELADANPNAYSFLQRANENPHDKELAQLTGMILGLIEEGKFVKRTNPQIILQEIERLTTTERGKVIALRRLQNAGEYSVMYMVDAIAKTESKDALSNIIWALPQIGRDAVRPLAAALPTENTGVKAEIIRAMGDIGYPQSLGYLKYIIENDASPELSHMANEAIRKIDPAALNVSAAQLFYVLAENYYYHADSLEPAEDADFANVWFWNNEKSRLERVAVDKAYFYELMAMRCCEWSLRADPDFGRAIGLWLAAFFKAESTGIEMPAYFGEGHAEASVYATTAGPEYLHQALSMAIDDKDAYVALGVVEALATSAGPKSLFYTYGPAQPLMQALSYDQKSVRYSAAIAVAEAGPKQPFAEAKLVVKNLADAITENPANIAQDEILWNSMLAESYALRAAKALLNLVKTNNPVIDISAAESELIESTKRGSAQILKLSGQVLAYFASPQAQKAITDMALGEDNPMDVRIAAFNSLSTSARNNGNLLEAQIIDSIYDLVSLSETSIQLRTAAAAAYGSLNLPSEKVKDLILDQAKK